MPTKIQHGCRVSERYGETYKDDGMQRSSRRLVVGTVVEASGEHRWKVRFDYNGEIKECASQRLKFVSDPLRQSATPAATAPSTSSNTATAGSAATTGAVEETTLQ